MYSILLKRNMKWCFLSIWLNIFLGIAALNFPEHYSDFTFWFMIYINIVIFGLMLKFSRQSIDVLEPFYAVIFLYTLYAWTAALAELYGGNGRFLSIMPIYYRCMIIGILAFMIGYGCIQHSKVCLIKGLNRYIFRFPFMLFYKILIFCAIALALFNYENLLNIFGIGNILPYTKTAGPSRMARTPVFAIVSYIGQVSIMLILGVLFIKSFVKKKLSIIGVIFFGVYAIVSIMAGGKSIIIMFVTVLLIYYNYSVKRIGFKPVVICALTLLVFSTLLSHVRVTTSIPDMIRLSVGYVNENYLYLTPLYCGEFTGPPRTLMNVIDATENGNMNFSFGSTFVADMAIFIPRIIYPDRPLPVPERYMEIFHPGQLAQGKGEGNFIPTEGYWAFGYIGVFMVMFAYGALVATFYNILRKNLDNGVVVFLYSLVYFPLITTGMRTGLIGSIKGTAMVVMPFFVIIFLSRMVLKNGKRSTLGTLGG